MWDACREFLRLKETQPFDIWVIRYGILIIFSSSRCYPRKIHLTSECSNLSNRFVVSEYCQVLLIWFASHIDMKAIRWNRDRKVKNRLLNELYRLINWPEMTSRFTTNLRFCGMAYQIVLWTCITILSQCILTEEYGTFTCIAMRRLPGEKASL